MPPFHLMTLGVGSGRRWQVLALAAALIVGLATSISIFRNPVQVTDSLLPMLDAQEAASAGHLFVLKLNEAGYSRPFYWVAIKLLFDVSDGHYGLAYKLFHVTLIAALLTLLVIAARVRNRIDLFAFTFALMVLTGTYSFLGMVWEGYPVNHYLEVAVFCMAALVLCLRNGSAAADIAAPLLFAVAALTLESGLLVWVVLVAARLVGLRGVSTRSLVVTTALLAAYMLGRFVVLDIGAPDIAQRATGFGFSRIEPDEIRARFGTAPDTYVLYAYNIACAFASVFLSDPMNGQWLVLKRLLDGRIDRMTLTTLVSAAMSTVLLVRFIWMRRAALRRREFDYPEQIVLIALAVAFGNAAICYSYIKDEVMSTAGVFYALAVFVAAREALKEWNRPLRIGAAALLGTAIFVGSTAWTLRSARTQYQMLKIGADDRLEWAHVDEWLASQGLTSVTASQAQLVETLRLEAMTTSPISRRAVPRWIEEWLTPQ